MRARPTAAGTHLLRAIGARGLTGLDFPVVTFSRRRFSVDENNQEGSNDDEIVGSEPVLASYRARSYASRFKHLQQKQTKGSVERDRP